jgi:chromosome segregation ATPase
MSIETLVEELRAKFREEKLNKNRIEDRIDRLSKEIRSINRILKERVTSDNELKETIKRLEGDINKLQNSLKKLSSELQKVKEENKKVIDKVETKTFRVLEEIPKLHEIRKENMEKLKESVKETKALIEERFKIKEVEIEEKFNNLQKELEEFKKLHEKVLLSFQTQVLNEVSKKIDKNLLYLNSLIERKLSEVNALNNRVSILERDFERYVDVAGIVKRVDLLINKLSILSQRIDKIEEKLKSIEGEKIEVRQRLFEILNIFSYSTEATKIMENLRKLEGIVKRMKVMGMWDEYYEDYVRSILSTLAENWRIYGYHHISHLFSNSLERMEMKLPSPKPDQSRSVSTLSSPGEQGNY